MLVLLEVASVVLGVEFKVISKCLEILLTIIQGLGSDY